MASIVLEESPVAVTNRTDEDVELLAIANDTKDALLSAIGHDLWPPLSVIAGFAETLRRDANLMSKTDREAVKRIADNAERIELVLRRLLGVSEDLRLMRAARSSRVDLSLLIHDALRRSRPSTQCIHT
ncbi:MAG TPA: histidine kinase dimerization/phospho-acceptor domain-containing protein, partial [Actinomycetota bacterium]|nr:histidine kinase dimerization/phospho-acceptor domain-containing protein [Actinomycetota bacterium]